MTEDRPTTSSRDPGADRYAALCRRVAELRSEIGPARTAVADRGRRDGNGDGNGNVVPDKRAAYDRLVRRIRALVGDTVPADATVAVISKGDGELLKFDGRRGWHFPRDDAGNYAGHHPADSAAAIRHLEAVRSRGADFLVIPQTSFWWLDFYGDFRKHLENRCTPFLRDDACVIFGMRGQEPRQASPNRPAGQDDAAAPAPAGEAEARLELAGLLTAAGRGAEALSVLREGADADPDGDPRLLLELVRREGDGGNAAAADRYAERLLERRGRDDHDTLLELARAAWRQGRLSVAEQRLTRLAEAFPADERAAEELTRLYCARLDVPPAQADLAILARFQQHLVARPATGAGAIPPAARLRAAEVLSGLDLVPEALRNAAAAAPHLDLASPASTEARALVVRLLRPAVSENGQVPFGDPRALAAFLSHAGNGFAAVGDRFRAALCYHLAAATGADGWDSAAWAARFNLAFMEMAEGCVAEALGHLSKVSRVYPDEAAQIPWPRHGPHRWPWGGFDLSAAFERLKPAGRPWPRITVVTPSFNHAAYLEETLLSVLNQHYPALEYIVVDGNSADGSADILRRYEALLAGLIIEPDRGQTDAINKGFRRATGELITWINSDDMLAPGALFVLALAYLLEEDADLLAGICLEHADHRFRLANLPAATQETFNVECLGDIFGRWFKGQYFYQPEVVFTRRILDKAGGLLDDGLHYVMDYDLWLRCAKAGGRLATVHWPIALFRKHGEQKTAALNECIFEQAKVRDRFVVPRPGAERRLEIRRRLARATGQEHPTVAVVSTRASKVFSADAAREATEVLSSEGLAPTFLESLEDVAPNRFDLIILCANLYKEQAPLRRLREAGHDGAVVGWLWDNHHHPFDNHQLARDFDVCTASHGFAENYLRSGRYLMEPPLPACTTQWSWREAEEFFRLHGDGSRTDALYGGFVRYTFAAKRNRLIERLIESGTEGVYFLDEDALDRYFGLSPEQRFRRWASHKASVCVPVAHDLAQRFYDALLTGQIPLVAPDVPDLDVVVPPDLQRELPVLRFRAYTAGAVRDALDEARSLFDRDGPDGARRRHRYAAENHTFPVRLRSILATVRRLSAGL